MINYTILRVQQNTLGGVNLNYECVEGYEPIKGDQFRYCSSDGVWSGTNLECHSKISSLILSLSFYYYYYDLSMIQIGKSCGAPIVPENAVISEEIFRIEKEKYFFGDLIVYSCKSGYKNEGSSFIVTCTHQGTWSSDISCKKISTKHSLNDYFESYLEYVVVF